MAAMINEAADVVHEGIALRPSDVDVTLLYGYGFPRYRGGPLKYADMYGLEKIIKDIKEFEKEELKDINGVTTKEDAPADSPLTKATNPHPDPKRK